ncbi:MAG: type I DNA topoisomerase [Candidatus Kapabacteria bacterium]|nr:type I DNA topoisomerase [Candidatus Kapabacteria bacterium]
MSEKNLVIVESPAKAKTIERYLGKDFKVVSSMGHVRDLPKDDKAIDIKNNFKPQYEVTPDKKQIVNDLKKKVKESDVIWLATDADREGEAIAWHLKEALNIGKKPTKRIVFREITKTAIEQAIKNPREIDENLVNAQQARRILDRLVGFELSPVLWKKIKRGLSAGRVQSAAVRLVVEREREIDSFNSKSSFKITAFFDLGNGKTLKAELPKNFENEKDAKNFLEKCKNAEFTLSNIEVKTEKQKPSAPFTTSTLQQEASRKLGFSVTQTMTVAQKLYEAGKISYMRTDSTNLSEEALQKAAAEIKQSFGDEYLKTRQYQVKSENAQEAHEAIRPTDFSVQDIGMGRNEQRLYNLIWKRAIASQMAEALIDKTIATISISTVPQNLIATAESIKFDGFLKVYMESKDEEEEDEKGTNLIPKLDIGQKLNLKEMKATEKFTNPPPRYTEASLVKKLEELGIGRPSTYAPTISTIQKRGYVIKESREGKERFFKEYILSNNQITLSTNKSITGAEKNKLYPTSIAMIVNDFLVEHFSEVVDYSFTANIEKELDEIALGEKQWQKMLGAFYKDFHNDVEKTTEKKRSEAISVRELGIDPKSGEKVYARLARYGPVVQIGESNNGSKPKFASLKPNQLIENITLEEALDLFKLPREIGTFEGKPMIVSKGRFGPYILHDSSFYSLGKDDDPFTIEQDRAVEIILEKRKKDEEKIIKVFQNDPELKILKGRWGPYISYKSENYRLPKNFDLTDISYEKVMEIVKGTEASKPTKKAKK